jgi:hypothetical protein
VFCLQLQPGAGAPAALASLERVASVRLRHVVTGLAWDGDSLVACDDRDGAHLLRLAAPATPLAPRALQLLASERAARPACGVAVASGCAVGIDRDGYAFSFSAATSAENNTGEAADTSSRDASGLSITARYRLGGVPTAVRAVVNPGGGAAFTVATLLGGVVMLSPLTMPQFEALCEAEACAAVHPVTAPLLGAEHAAARGGVPAARRVLDGDLLAQLLLLPAQLQRAVLSAGSWPALGDDRGAVLDLIDRVLSAHALQ